MKRLISNSALLLLLSAVWAFAQAQSERIVSGILFGKDEITIKAKSQGEMTELRLDEGQAVKVNETIAIIDDRQETIERNLASVEFETAQSDFEKTRDLGKYVSEEEVTLKKNEFLKKKSQFELKEYALSNTRVASPIDGWITKRYFDRGETVGTGDKVFEVVKLDPLVMEMNILPEDLKMLRTGAPVTFHTDIHPNRAFQGIVTYISPVIDAASGTIKVKLEVKNPRLGDGSYELRPGTVTTVRMDDGSGTMADQKRKLTPVPYNGPFHPDRQPANGR